MKIEEQIMDLLNQPQAKPLSVNGLQEALGMESAEDFKALVKTLVQMEQEGKVMRSRSNRYGLPEQMNYLRGRFIGHAKGFGFVAPETEGMDDVFIPPTEVNTAMNGDVVLVQVKDEQFGDRREGSIVKIVERKTRQVVGLYQDNKGFGFVIPDDKKIPSDIFIGKGNQLHAMDGHKVVVEIIEWPSEDRSATGMVTQVLGHKNDPGVDILSIIYKHGITIDFPQEVLDQANALPDEVLPEEIAARTDLREELTVTIDGADAKDLDDAISVEKFADGSYRLSVHISDVSYYVTEGSPMDAEAYERSTSVYLTDRVIPMLPHKLSNGICSLNPHVDRLVLTCQMMIDSTGKVTDHQFFESVIRSKERMTYTDVYEMLENQDAALMEKYEAVVPMLQQMAELAEVLREKRMRRGAIDFDFKESKVLVDEEGWPTDVVVIERTVSERLIEEFMLAANETVAEHFHWLQVPFLYRIHENPKPEKLQRFFEFLTNFGVIVKGAGNEIHPHAMQEIIDSIQGLPEEAVISTMLLRSLQQARYNEESLGHFGLSTDYYTHFTAPIRRYPDLIVHRLLRLYAFKKDVSPATLAYWENELPDIAEHTSSRERRAVDAERDTISLKQAQFMVDKVGEEFEGIVASVTNFGMFIELENTIEGLVHVSEMSDDYYRFDERHMMMIGERTAKQFRIGSEVQVQVISVKPEEGAIDFRIVGMPAPQPRSRKVQPKVIQAKKRTPDRKGKKPSASGTPSREKKTEGGRKKKFYEGVAKKGTKKRRRKR